MIWYPAWRRTFAELGMSVIRSLLGVLRKIDYIIADDVIPELRMGPAVWLDRMLPLPFFVVVCSTQCSDAR